MSYIRELSKDVEIHDESKVYKGYTLFAPFNDNRAWLIDMEGRVVNYWEMKTEPGCNCRLLANGNLMWLGRGPGAWEDIVGNGTELIEVDWDGNELWRYDDVRLHHDFVCLENGNKLVLRFVDIPEEIQKKIKGGAPGTKLGGKIVGVGIREITDEKEVVWEWKGYEHLNTETDIECYFASMAIWAYTNSIDVFPNGDILLSFRNFNTVARINKKTGDIIWRWGPEHYLGHQHCASVLDNGNILIFDNGIHRRPIKEGDPIDLASLETSRLVEVNPKTNEIVWEFIDPTHLLYTPISGSAQRLPNGNTFICESRSGIFYEITYEKEIVWKYVSPFTIPRPSCWGWTLSKNIFQAHRYGIDFEGFKGKNLDPDRFEWIIRKKSKETLDIEARIRDRLAKTGY